MAQTGPQPGQKFVIVGNYLVLLLDDCTCSSHYGAHERHCGMEPIGPIDELLQDPLWFPVIEKLEPKLSDPSSKKEA